jgi:hypothetical protein
MEGPDEFFLVSLERLARKIPDENRVVPLFYVTFVTKKTG